MSCARGLVRIIGAIARTIRTTDKIQKRLWLVRQQRPGEVGNRDGAGLWASTTPGRYDPRVRDAWSRLGKPQTYAQAWLSAVIIGGLLGVCFAAIGLLTNWEMPWPQFAVLMPAWYVVIVMLRFTYDTRRRRRFSRSG